MKRRLIALALIFAAPIAMAGQYSYFCSVQNVYQLEDDGSIAQTPAQSKLYRDERFSVDRKTGTLTGEKIPAFLPTKYVVLFPGGNGNSFKSYYQGHNFVSYLEVFEYRPGKAKPFVLHDSIFIYTGFCE